MRTCKVLYQHGSLQGHLTEIMQTKMVKFAFLYGAGDILKTFHPLVKCRDYLSDILHFKATGGPVGIYGMSLPPQDNLLDVTRTRLLVQLPDGAAKQFIQNFEFIQRFEQENFEIAPAKLFAVDGDPSRFVIDADPFWMNCTQLVSLLTFLCRCSLYLESPEQNWIGVVSASNGVDGQYMKKLMAWKIDYQIPFFSKLDYSLSPTPSGYPVDSSVDRVHDSGGILTFAQRGWSWEREGVNRHTHPQYAATTQYIRENVLVKQMSALTGIE